MSETNNSTAPAATNVSTEGSQDPNVDANNQTNQEAQPITPKLSKKLKLKIEGQEYEENLPFEFDENNKEHVEYLRRNLQMSKVASKRMNEAALTRKQAEQFFLALQQDPMRVLNDPKIMGEEKFRAIAEQYLAKKLQEQMMSPEERKKIEMEERLRSYEEQEKKTKEALEAKQIQQLEEHYADQYQKTIMSALQSSSLPKNPFTVKRMAELMQKNIQHGLELEPQHLAQLVREDYQRELAQLIGGADADQIISMFGEDVSNKIRKYDLAKFKSQSGVKNGQASVRQELSQPAPTRKMRPDEYEAFLRGKK